MARMLGSSRVTLVLLSFAGASALGSACNALTGTGDLTVRTSSSEGGAGSTSHVSSSSSSGSTHGGGGHGGTTTTSTTTITACAGSLCGGHGTCSEDGGVATCACEVGYHAVGLDCALDETCAGKSCGDCGHCEVAGGVASCLCPTDYAWNGAGCKLAIDPCANAGCGADEYCVPEAHCQPLGACVATCDCSNCGNCGPDNSDGRWNDWQEYCGAQPNQSPATMECKKPCPPGSGCLPYAVPICWPIEGCFSL